MSLHPDRTPVYPHLPRRPSQTHSQVYPWFAWRYCFMLAPNACMNLCALFKSGVSFSPSPMALLHSGPSSLQSKCSGSSSQCLTLRLSWRDIFMWERPCVFPMCPKFWGMRAAFSMDVCHPPLSSVYAGHYPLDWRWGNWWCGDLSLPCILSRSSPFHCSYCCPARGRVYSLAVGIEAHISVSELCFWSSMWNRWDLSTPNWREASEYSSSGAVSVLSYHFSPIMLAHKYHHWN